MEGVKSLIVAGIIILVIIAGGMFFYSRSNSPRQTSAQNIQNASAKQTNTHVPASGVEDISLTASGFTPKSIIVSPGTRIKWTNTSGKVGDLESDPYPAHTSYPAMNFGPFSDGSSVELVLSKPGAYKYHNNVNPGETGIITVQ